MKIFPLLHSAGSGHGPVCWRLRRNSLQIRSARRSLPAVPRWIRKLLQRNVSKALKEAKGVPARGITVATHAGTIVLTGEVDTEAQRVAALSVAEKAAGGVRISSNIEVRPLEDRSPQGSAGRAAVSAAGA